MIPAYGFVIPRAARDRARDLLRVFDLQPGDEGDGAFSGIAGRRPVIGEGADITWSLPVFPHGETAYRHVAPVRFPWRFRARAAGSRPDVVEMETTFVLRRIQGALSAIRGELADGPPVSRKKGREDAPRTRDRQRATRCEADAIRRVLDEARL